MSPLVFKAGLKVTGTINPEWRSIFLIESKAIEPLNGPEL